MWVDLLRARTRTKFAPCTKPAKLLRFTLRRALRQESRVIEGAQKIFDEIMRFFDADRQTDQSWVDADLVQLFVRQLEEAHDRGLFDQAFYSAE
jgi:hypothetical protein